jgi:hypothetical protein
MVTAQQKDSLRRGKDSLWLYKKIKKAAYKYKLTRLAYDAVFVDPEPKEYPVDLTIKAEVKQVNPYLKARGEIIRKVNIRVYDPFGYNVADTVARKINTIQKTGNKLHITTYKFIIANRLLFKENDVLDALKLSESERILRAAVFVNDARVYVTPTSSDDSVDVNVVVLDKWPITIPTLITDQFASARFRNQNLLGLGQQFEQYGRYSKSGATEYSGFYNISNIDNTFISAQLGYNVNNTTQETSTYLSLDKPFYSFFATWAGGINLAHTWTDFTVDDTIDQVTKRIPIAILNYDVWLAKTIKLSDKKTLFNQSTNLIVGGRYFATEYLNRPSFDIDTSRNNRNSHGFLGNLGFGIQQYYKDKFIYRFGANEDVPEGLIVQFLYGGLKTEDFKIRYYNGVEIARAKHFYFGYLSATFSYGIFYNIKVPNDITTNYKLYYFSDLKRRGNWYFRQFLNYTLVHGENKLLNQKITLRPEDLYGFNSGNLRGNTKMFLNSETVAYMPYNLIGFRFAPVLMIGMGMIGDPQHRLIESRLYQGYSLGIMVRNENLLSSTFQISVGLYPFLPENKGVSVVYNPVTSFTLRVRAFSFSRPDFISY